MKLIGSSTSPYVRRIRLLLADAGQGYEFSDLNIYGSDRDLLKQQTPALKIPVLIDGDQTLYDSRVISRYLQTRLGLQALSWQQENLLTLVDAVNDSWVTLLMAQRSGLDVTEDRLLFNLQRERIDSTLSALDERVSEGEFEVWQYPAICLYCLLDWGLFRELVDLEQHPWLRDWYQSHGEQPGVEHSDPRRVA